MMSAPSGKPVDYIKIVAPSSADQTRLLEFSPATQPGHDAEHLSSASEAEETRDDSRLRKAFKERIAAYDSDLERLETALSAAHPDKADERASRLPPAPQLPRTQGLPLADDGGIQVFSLSQPFYVPLAPHREARKARRAVLLGAVVGVPAAALIAYYAVSHDGAGNQPLTAASRPKVSAIETQIAELPPRPATPPQANPSLPASQMPEQLPARPPQQPANPDRVQTAAPAAPRETSSVATELAIPSPAPPRTSSAGRSPIVATPPAQRPAPQIGREAIAMLLKQGEQFVSVGDVAAARTLFERAAEAGDGNAALALGATYDPAILRKLGVRGIAPDADKAQYWYQKARDYGSPETPTWLAKLASQQGAR